MYAAFWLVLSDLKPFTEEPARLRSAVEECLEWISHDPGQCAHLITLLTKYPRSDCGALLHAFDDSRTLELAPGGWGVVCRLAESPVGVGYFLARSTSTWTQQCYAVKLHIRMLKCG